MSGVSYYRFDTATDLNPNDSTATTYNYGFNTVSGPLESIILHQTLTVTAADRNNTDQSSFVRACRIVADGETVFDFRAGHQATDGPGLFAAVLNQIGGRAYTIPTSDASTSLESWWTIPVGKNLGMGGMVSRIEVTIEYYTHDASVTSGSFETWGRYNSNATRALRLLSPQSFVHSDALEQVNLKTSPNVPGVIDALIVMNDSAEDGIGSQGIRLMSQSQFPMPLSMWRHLNGDVANGFMYDGSESLAEQSYAVATNGLLVAPLYGLAVDGDLTIFVDSSEATTRTYSIVRVAQFGATAGTTERQTAKSTADYQADILRKAENQ